LSWLRIMTYKCTIIPEKRMLLWMLLAAKFTAII
jgi:hypothetical protein